MMRIVPACFAAALALAPVAVSAQSDSKPAAADAKKAQAKRDAKKPEAKKPDARKPSAKPAGETSGTPGGATLVQSFGDWGAYTAQNGRSRLCYALSEPKSRAPGSLKDTKAYLFVSFRPADNVKNEVASVLNFNTKEDGPASLSIGQTNYELVTRGQNAWIKTPSEEAQAIGTMSKGGTLTVQATSARGNKTNDRYSLSGFVQALDRAKRDCP